MKLALCYFYRRQHLQLHDSELTIHFVTETNIEQASGPISKITLLRQMVLQMGSTAAQRLRSLEGFWSKSQAALAGGTESNAAVHNFRQKRQSTQQVAIVEQFQCNIRNSTGTPEFTFL